MYKHLKKISTVGMSHEEWLAHRKNSIGGSDAAGIVGMNSYSSPYSVWAEKLDKLPPVEDNEAMRLGRDLEEYVAKRFTEKTGKKVQRDNAIIYNPDLPWAHANIDRRIVGEDAILECKTCSALSLSKFKNGEFPDNYYVQCVHYIAVTGAQKAYLAVLVLGKEFLVFEIERDEDEICSLMAEEEEFWLHVQNGTPPPTDGMKATSDALGAVYPKSNDKAIGLYAFDLMLMRRESLKNQIEAMQDHVAQIDNQIKAEMGDAGKGDSGNYKVSWLTQTRSTFDRKKYEKDFGPIPAAYLKSSESRVFKVTKKG